MNLILTFEQAQEQFPEAIQDIENQRKAGKSKNKSIPLSELKWSIDWCVTGRSYSFQEVLQKATEEKPPEPATFEEYWEGKKGCYGVSLRAHLRQSSWYSHLKEVPHQIIDLVQKSWEEDQTENARIDALTPEEFDKETQDLIDELSGNPGFVQVNISFPRKENI